MRCITILQNDLSLQFLYNLTASCRAPDSLSQVDEEYSHKDVFVKHYSLKITLMTENTYIYWVVFFLFKATFPLPKQNSGPMCRHLLCV